jgi:NADH dehydrogenase [ubiquinone] 1 alpha subcomplex assembly factor 5
MLGGATLQELRIACTLGALERAGGVSPRVSPLAQVRDAGNLLTRAGLALPAVDVDDVAVLYPDAVGLVRHLRAMGESAAVRARPPALPRDAALAAAALYSALFAERGAGAGLEGGSEGGSADSEQRTAGSGESSALDPVPATFQVVYMTGWSPAPGQAGPRARGSATVSLADLEAALAEADGGDGKGRA